MTSTHPPIHGAVLSQLPQILMSLFQFCSLSWLSYLCTIFGVSACVYYVVPLLAWYLKDEGLHIMTDLMLDMCMT